MMEQKSPKVTQFECCRFGFGRGSTRGETTRNPCYEESTLLRIALDVPFTVHPFVRLARHVVLWSGIRATDDSPLQL
jgi:hypothetical protein